MMKQPISRKQHGAIDYSYIPLMAIAPDMVGFENEKAAKNITQALSGAVLVSGLLTKAEWGMIKLVPYKAHLIMDAAVSLFALGAPWLFRFHQNKKARNTLITAGIAGLVAVALSRPEEMPDSKKG